MPTPDFIAEAANQALRRGETFYTYKAGLPSCAKPSPIIWPAFMSGPLRWSASPSPAPASIR
jgi:hypothetical protein